MRTLIALSGGVDSAVAAALLLREGHELVGVTLKNWCTADREGAPRSCCSREAIACAQDVARSLDFPHFVLDVERLFTTRVIEPFVRDYTEGRTPNPCVACNAELRFPFLERQAEIFGCEKLATGHYARLHAHGRSVRIRRGRDSGKDQSYALWAVSAENLSRLLLPVGDLTKAEVRRLAVDFRLEAAARPESQDACFIPGNDHGAFLEELHAGESVLPATLRPGEIVTAEGRVIGTHAGVARYTVGQRKGLGIALGRPVYVVRLEPATNRVVVGEESALLRGEALLRDVRWPEQEATHMELSVQLRARHRAARARLERLADHAARVRFAVPQRAITPGQSAVFYDGDVVVGGGIVADDEEAA